MSPGWGGGAVQKHSCKFITNHTSSAAWGEGGQMSPPLPNSGSVSKCVLSGEDSSKESS